MLNRMVRFLLMAGILLGMFTAMPVQHAKALGTDRYVSTTGSDSSDCSATPCRHISYAITQSGAVTADQIHIAAGTYHENLTINKTVDLVGAGENLTFIDGSALGTVIGVSSVAVTTLSDLTVQHGNAASEGGGIFNTGNLTLLRVIVSTNTASSGGGGIYNYGDSAAIPPSPGILSLTDVYISGNTVTAGAGGGLFGYSTSDIYLSRVTVSGNTASAYSGGIHNQGAGLYLTNVTISNNTAHLGGGMTVTASSSATIVNSTIAYNHLDAGGSVGGIQNYALIDIVNTIVYGNDGENCLPGALTSSGYNIDGDSTCLTPTIRQLSDMPGTNPLLGPLANNGGYVPTHALLAGSPAIDATIAPCPVIDAASWPRPQDGNGDTVAVCDIGAFEAPASATYKSVSAYDGWVLESTATSSKGGTKSASGTTFYIGDNAAKKQYRAILHFNTAGFPATAIISKATLRMMRSAGGSGNTSTLGALLADIKKPYFGTAASLAITDFQATASKTKIFNTFTRSGSWYSATLKSTGFTYVNRTGTTQFRVYFTKGDDHDSVADYLKFYSGSASTANRPQLVIQYYVP